MGMFSAHFVIVQGGGLLWTGDGWSNDPHAAIRIFDKRSAEKIVTMFFKDRDDIKILEDE